LGPSTVEQLCEAQHIWPWCSHLFVCPAIMTAQWRKSWGKSWMTCSRYRPAVRFGQAQCTSHLLLHSSVLFCHVDLGRLLEVLPGWLSLKICCMECGAVIFKLNRVICGNSGCNRGLGLGAYLSARQVLQTASTRQLPCLVNAGLGRCAHVGRRLKRTILLDFGSQGTAITYSHSFNAIVANFKT
jgi:hypothetical protein